MIRSLLRFFLRSSVGRFERSIKDPVGCQNRVLTELLCAAQDTSYGRRFKFSEILTAEDPVSAFQSTVPLTTYDDLLPDFRRMKGGEANVLWPGVVNDYAISSGTSAATNKELPVTDRLFERFNRFAQTIVGCHLIEMGSIASVKGLSVAMTSTVVGDPDRPEVRVGQVSGLVAARSKRSWLRNFFSQPIPNEIIEAPTLDEKIDLYVDHALGQDVRMLAMIPWLVLRFLDRALEKYNAAHSTTATSVHDFWPNLSLVICGGQNLAQYRPSIQQRIGHRPVHMIEMYGASESMFALQKSISDQALYLHPDNLVFFEFVPYDEFGTKQPQRLSVAQVETGKPYVVYVTTCSGLWCYCMDDVVEFTSTYPHCIRILGRASEILNIHNVLLTGSRLRQVIDEFNKETGCKALASHVSVHRMESDDVRLRWLIEFDQLEMNPDEITKQLDAILAQVAPELGKLPLSKRLLESEVVPIPLAGFDEWVKRSAGGGHAQAKIPLVSNDCHFSDEIIQMVSLQNVN